jgi:hypothetical protein
MPSKRNCWEYKLCGRQPGGSRVSDLGVCPAATFSVRDGKNGGKNAGRYCWRTAGTFCGGKVQGTYAVKLVSCKGCDFFKLVSQEEGASFQE